MIIIFSILIVSLAFNAVFYYMNRSWKLNFTEKLNENNFFEDDHVNVEVERYFGKVRVSVQSKELNFSVIHDMDNQQKIENNNNHERGWTKKRK